MNATLFKTLLASVPTCLLLSGSTILWLRQKTMYAFLQVSGAVCIALVLLTHVFEALHVFPSMQWGLEHSVGHYVDLVCAVLGLTLFPLGYLLQAIFVRLEASVSKIEGKL